MRKIQSMAAAAVGALALAGAASAQEAHDHSAQHAHASAPAAVQAAGIVRGVDAKAGTVTLEHEAIPALNWPAMTMPFKVSDAALLNDLKVGAKVRFHLQGQQIVRIEAL